MNYTARSKIFIWHDVPNRRRILVSSFKWPYEHVTFDINTKDMVSKQQQQIDLSIMPAPSCYLLIIPFLVPYIPSILYNQCECIYHYQRIQYFNRSRTSPICLYDHKLSSLISGHPESSTSTTMNLRPMLLWRDLYKSKCKTSSYSKLIKSAFFRLYNQSNISNSFPISYILQQTIFQS